MSPPPGTGVRLQAADLNATLLALGELTGFFVPDGDDVAVDAGIFADPLAADYLGGIPGRAGKLAALIATILPPAAEFGPTDTLPTGNVWLPITVPDSESDSSTADSPEPDGDSGKEPAAGADGSAPARLAYLVVPPDDATSGVFGFGVWRKFEPVTGVEITLSVFVPVVQVGPTAVSFALLDHPILATVGIAGPSGSFLGQKVSLNGLAVTASLHLNGTAPSFKLSCLDTTPPIADTYATLAELISSGGTVTEYLNAVIGSAPVTQVLGIAVAGEGDSAVTVGEVFVALGVLQAATPPAYQLVDLAAAFGGKSPIAIAETMLFRSLDLVIKALGDRPVIPIEIAGSKGGLYLASESMADGSERFGVRLAVTDLAITAAPEPSIVLQIGELLSGEQTDEAWMVRAGGSAAEPGISVFVLHVTGLAETDPQLSLVIDVEAVSIGVDIAGADDKPLIDVDGYTLAKIEARAMVVPGEHGIVVGAAVKVDGLGIPPRSGVQQQVGQEPGRDQPRCVG